jgi:TatD DNase family protein
MLIDAHNHLQDERFAGRQDQLIAEARAAGVGAMMVNGSSEEDWPAVADLARRHPGFILPNFGYHPWYIHQRSPAWADRLQALLAEFPAAGVGEIGLDRWKAGLSWDGQEEVFLRQVNLAAERGRVASIHCLKAWGRLVELLEANPRPACGFILHSYGGSAELVDRLAPLGAYFSCPGCFARPDKEHKLDAFRRVPAGRLLVETDAPDQLPPEELITHPLADPAGQPINHPANLAAIARWLELQGLHACEPPRAGV